MATELAKAYVQIIPTAEGIKGKLSEALGGEAESAGKAAGEKAGSSFGSVLSGAAKAGVAAVAAVGTAAAAASTKFVQAIGGTAAYGDEIDKMSQKMGLSAEAYQEWDAIMQHSGTSIQSMQSSMKTLANAVENGNEAFERIGLTQEEIAKMSNEELFAATIAGLQNIENETERTYLAGQLLGRGATELGALLNTSAEDTEKMRQRVHELGGVMSDEAVKAAAAYQDSLQDMQTAFSGLTRNLTAEFMPAITGIMDGLTEIFSGNSEQGLAMVSQGVKDVVAQISETLPQFVELGGQVIASLVTAITENLPMLLSAGLSLVETIGTAILDNLPLLVQTALDLCLMLGTYLVEAAPALVDAAVQLVDDLASWIGEYADVMAEAAVTIIITLFEALTDPDNIGTLVDAAIFLIVSLADAIVSNLPALIEKAPVIVENLVRAIIENAPKLLKAALELIIMAAQGLIDNLPRILAAAGSIVEELVRGLIEFGAQLIQTGGDLVARLIDGIREAFQKLVNAGKEIVDTVKNGFQQKIQDAKNWGRDLIANFIAGIKEKWENLKSSVSNIASTVKSFLGHSHPTEGPMADDNTWMPDMMRSFAQGIRDNRGLVLGEMDKLANDMSGSLDWGSPAFAMAGGPAYNAGAGAGSAAASELRGIVDALRGMRVVLSTGETVGALTVPLNDSLGNQYSYSKRGI